MCTRHEMLVLRSSGGLRMSPALMSPRSSWHSVCIVIMASIAQCRHSQTLRIRSQSCQRQSKLPRLPTTNECKRESKRQRTGRAANEQLAANDIPNVMLKPNSSIIGPLSCTPNPSRIFTSIVNGAPSRRCVLIGVCPCMCVCVSLSQIASSHRKRTHNRRTLDIGCFRTATTLVLLCKPPIDKSKSENLQTLCVSVWCECVCVCV